MRLVTVRRDGRTQAGRVEGDSVTLLGSADVGGLLKLPDWRALAQADGERISFDPLGLAPLVVHPGKVICVGLNYANHIVEMGRELPDSPTLFTKFDSSLCGPTDSIALPQESTKVDWEAELAVVIGSPARRVPVERALDHVAGYTVMNAVSMRDWQNRTTQWLAGKAWEASSPLGPVLVTPDELPEGASGLRISCAVNGEIVQDDNTDDLLFGAAALIADISIFTTLQPGDVIATGTPGGVGAGRTPPMFLGRGDRMRTEIEGIGSLDNLLI
ncbi:MAG: fumarylacetoacetate hydrolase family protein [Phycisphaerales bacterium]